MIGLDDALTSFEAAAFIGANWASGEQVPEWRATPRRGGGEILVTEFDAKQMLKAHGLAVPEGVLCKARDAAAAADRLGYPVTLKVSSPAIAHKTEAGGVVLDLATAA